MIYPFKIKYNLNHEYKKILYSLILYFVNTIGGQKFIMKNKNLFFNLYKYHSNSIKYFQIIKLTSFKITIKNNVIF